ncbi:glycoside hydrolase family 43 protein [Lactiplantibacillus modestisalitolerans]|uniref:Family 43 glycosylhydrolase n=1 Tax=Lactiplantibacillus modestisalitolerans TaxID=1457219 RepID=A0ABV5WSW8_9LACO|nr:glycoside hydrolase family 43 protein [Lactiplantibacillus modestisalitolerans]
MITTYQNPILRGMMPDPSIVQVNGVYYLANSTFEYYPGIAISKSTDLLNWVRLPGVIQQPAQADLSHSKSNEGIFAVCLRYHQGHFYVITTNFAEFKTFIIRGSLAADGAAIDWETQRTIVDVAGIDPDLYFEDGRTYVQFTGYLDDHGTKGIQQVEIDLTTGAVLTGPQLLTYGTGGRDVEGPHIIKKAGWYYLLMAEGGTGMGHMITMMRSRSLWGPFTAPNAVNPLFTNRDRANEPLQNIGHADLFQDSNGHWWLTCLGTRPASVGFMQITNLGRETLLYPVDWRGDWPVIYTGTPTQTVDLRQWPNHAASLTQPQALPDFEDNFKGASLRPEWLTLRANVPSLTVGPAGLRLGGNASRLTDLGTPAFVGLRQTEPDQTFQATVTAATALNSGQAGIVSLINVDHYAALLLQADSTGQILVIRDQRVADVHYRQVLGKLAALPQTLSITNHAATKTFTATTATNEQLSFTTDALNLSNEAIAALNTGDIQGLYAFDDAQLVIDHAERHRLAPEA